MAFLDFVTASSCLGSPDNTILALTTPFSEHKPVLNDVQYYILFVVIKFLKMRFSNVER